MNARLEHGDLAGYIPAGESWTVDQVVAATAYEPERVVLFRVTSDGGVIRSSVLDCAPDQVRLVRKVTDRTVFPGCELSDGIRPVGGELRRKPPEREDTAAGGPA